MSAIMRPTVRHDHRRRLRSGEPEASRHHRRAAKAGTRTRCGSSNGMMIVNHESFGKTGARRFRRRAGDLRRVEARRAEADHQMADRRRRRAPLRFRRPLRLYLADRRGLCRQHRDDPRPRRSGEAAGGRALVDSRPVDGRRRGISVGQLGAAALPPSAALRRPALCQLLAPRLLHSRHLRHVEAEADSRRQHRARRSRIRPTPACASRRS